MAEVKKKSARAGVQAKAASGARRSAPPVPSKKIPVSRKPAPMVEEEFPEDILISEEEEFLEEQEEADEVFEEETPEEEELLEEVEAEEDFPEPDRLSAEGSKDVRETLREAMGLLETKGLLAAIEATDAMCKSADIRMVSTEKIGSGLVTLIISGEVAAVQAAIDSGAETAARVDGLVASRVIPKPHRGIRTVLEQIRNRNL